MGKINDWLNPLKRDGIVKVNYENTTLKEDYIGSYLVFWFPCAFVRIHFAHRFVNWFAGRGLQSSS